MNSNDETYSVHSLRVETKEKLDAFLKSARSRKVMSRKKQMSSKEELLNESTTASSENLLEETEMSSKNYIMDKFLSGSGDDRPIPPVPKPRKSKIMKSPTISQSTYNVDKESISSSRTYQVMKDVIGDILVHTSPSPRKISIKAQQQTDAILEKGETETLSDDIKTVSSFDTTTSSMKDQKTEVKIEKTTKIQYENEVVKERKNKGKIKKQHEIKDQGSGDKNAKTYDYERIIEIIIHKSDRLLLNSLVTHPVVKIHLVDIETGKYFDKSDKNRSVVFFYENKNFDYISPVMTHAFSLQEKRTLVPEWEETILLNEDYEYLIDNSSRMILFFEIVDFVPFSAVNHQSNQGGWHNIAFAFLKISGKNGALNFGKRMRLQLFYSSGMSNKKADPHFCNVWSLWKKKKLDKYPSTLYVTLKSVISPRKVVDVLRSKTPIQGERGTKNDLFEEKQMTEFPTTETCGDVKNYLSGDEKKLIWRARLPHEICKVPNKCSGKLPSCDDGCLVMKFSNDGRFLACAVRKENLFFVCVYSISSLDEILKFPCHQGIIYTIKWSSNDSYIITASADNTISIFNITTRSFVQILPHPSFVYTCDISADNKYIISGCYDEVVRIWKQTNDDIKIDYHLFQELEGHQGYVTSICVGKELKIFSSDSTGVIKEWKKDSEWSIKREIILLDLKETIINQIVLFSKEKKILVHARDSTIRIVDVKSGCVLHWLRGALNKRMQTFCTVSPCGTYIIAGSENGFVHVWNSKSGQEVTSFTPLDNKYFAIHCVEFHPFGNILAISYYGQNLPILIYSHERDENDKEYTSNENRSDKKVKGVAHKNLTNKTDGRVDFKSILRKMDDVIVAVHNVDS